MTETEKCAAALRMAYLEADEVMGGLYRRWPDLPVGDQLPWLRAAAWVIEHHGPRRPQWGDDTGSPSR